MANANLAMANLSMANLVMANLVMANLAMDADPARRRRPRMARPRRLVIFVVNCSFQLERCYGMV